MIANERQNDAAPGARAGRSIDQAGGTTYQINRITTGLTLSRAQAVLLSA